MDGQQEEPQGQAFEEPLDNTLTDSLKSFAGEQPMLTALLALGVAGAYLFRRRAAGPDDVAVKGESIEEESKEQPATD